MIIFESYYTGNDMVLLGAGMYVDEYGNSNYKWEHYNIYIDDIEAHSKYYIKEYLFKHES